MLINWIQATVIWLSVVLFYLADRWLVQRIKRRQALPKSAFDLYWAFGMVMGILLAAQPLLLPAISFHTSATWGLMLQLAGVVIVLTGIALTAWAVKHLGRWHATAGNLLAGQVLIESGPYRYIRHPIFTGSILLAFGLCCVNPSVATGLILIYAVYNADRSANRDERRLVEELPGYVGYIHRTGRFFPQLLP